MKLKLNVGKEKKNIACHCKSKEIIIWTKILIFSRNENEEKNYNHFLCQMQMAKK